MDQLLRDALPSLGGGAALLLVDSERILYRKAFGNLKIDQVLPIASATKWLSGALILSLVDEGNLSLDDSVAQYMPDFTEQKAQITIRQLFAHTSGLPPEASCRNNRATSLEDCAKAIARLPLQAEPGATFHYGGVSMHVGGRVAEVATGKAWNDIFIEKIAGPLGMQQTDYHAYGATQNPRPAGDARSSLDEYGRFLQMLLNRGVFEGRRVLSREAVAEMLRDQTDGATLTYTIFHDKGHLDPDLPNARYGLGVWLEKHDSDTGEVLEASSPGALGAYPWLDLGNNIGGIILTRNTFSRSLPVYLKVKREYQEKLQGKGTLRVGG
ncbi:MAG TPA: serine hydrolase domain-containing protein [Pyrinomonadaceae bacterium]|nr:serine hydrolase domain-containing protein [Pyrinomonadaceae bacterium]